MKEEDEEERNSPPDGGRKKRAASTNLEAEAPKRRKGPSQITQRGTSTAAQSGAPETSPWPNREYSKTQAHSYIRPLYFIVLTC